MHFCFRRGGCNERKLWRMTSTMFWRDAALTTPTFRPCSQNSTENWFVFWQLRILLLGCNLCRGRGLPRSNASNRMYVLCFCICFASHWTREQCSGETTVKLQISVFVLVYDLKVIPFGKCRDGIPWILWTNIEWRWCTRMVNAKIVTKESYQLFY